MGDTMDEAEERQIGIKERWQRGAGKGHEMGPRRQSGAAAAAAASCARPFGVFGAALCTFMHVYSSLCHFAYLCSVTDPARSMHKCNDVGQEMREPTTSSAHVIGSRTGDSQL